MPGDAKSVPVQLVEFLHHGNTQIRQIGEPAFDIAGSYG